MTTAYVGMGSNIRPGEHFERALRLLGSDVTITAISTVYLTEALDSQEQPDYYNAVITFETALTPRALKLDVLRRVENDLGRVRTGDRHRNRTIDLDLILYDDLVMTAEDLTLPDPDILTRPFLAIPLLELAPGLTLPGSGLHIRDIAAGMAQDRMKPLTTFTDHLRKELLHGRKR